MVVWGRKVNEVLKIRSSSSSSSGSVYFTHTRMWSLPQSDPAKEYFQVAMPLFRSVNRCGSERSFL